MFFILVYQCFVPFPRASCAGISNPIFSCFLSFFVFCSLFQFPTLLYSAFALSVSGRFIMALHIFLNVLPCSGTVEKPTSAFNTQDTSTRNANTTQHKRLTVAYRNKVDEAILK